MDTPLDIIVKRDASVEEVIGYTLYEYVEDRRQPVIPQALADVIYWNMRIVEDDGSIDDDFPGMHLYYHMNHLIFNASLKKIFQF